MPSSNMLRAFFFQIMVDRSQERPYNIHILRKRGHLMKVTITVVETIEREIEVDLEVYENMHGSHYLLPAHEFLADTYDADSNYQDVVEHEERIIDIKDAQGKILYEII